MQVCRILPRFFRKYFGSNNFSAINIDAHIEIKMQPLNPRWDITNIPAPHLILSTSGRLYWCLRVLLVSWFLIPVSQLPENMTVLTDCQTLRDITSFHQRTKCFKNNPFWKKSITGPGCVPNNIRSGIFRGSM